MADKPSADPSDVGRIERAVRRVVLERAQTIGLRRDVHLKHHGLVWGWFEVRDDIDERLAHGVFQRGKRYPVWIRFSNSSKVPRPDTDPDGRGVAIKLLEVEGARLLSGEGAQQTTQDFIFLNGPAFFARNAAEMAVVAELEAEDRFPGLFFGDPAHLQGLAALAAMANAKENSPLDFTYFSQTPYRLGPPPAPSVSDAGFLRVKYRLRPVSKRPKGPSEPAAPKPKGDHFLFEALKYDLNPGDSDEQAPFTPADTDAVFEFGVQIGKGKAFPEDDATVVWDEITSPFIPVAEVRIPTQRFDSKQRMEFAEQIRFSPWNGRVEHRPLGSLNEARLRVYAASAEARRAHAKDHAYTREEWDAERETQPSATWAQPAVRKSASGFTKFLRLLAGLFTKPFAAFERGLRGPAGYFYAPVLWVAIILFTCFGYATWPCSPFSLDLSRLLPSEALIPPAVYGPRVSAEFRRDESVRKQNIAWLFRYAPTGSEYQSGLPYWIYRVLPSLFPENFGARKGWSEFGLAGPDDDDFYTSYHKLPRGLVLSDTELHLAGSDVRFVFKRVSFNCASCHRGEYLDENGKSHFVDGMPNVGIDTAGFKRAAFDSMTDVRFTPDRVIAAINRLLQAEHDTELTDFERIAYKVIVEESQRRARAKSIAWMGKRPENGPGRLDAFGALRFEFMSYGLEDQTNTVVDLPSIWHQSRKWRPLHHWDGNTDDTRARNFGAIVGVGGLGESIHQDDIRQIGRWLDQGLGSPKYPFPQKQPAELARGKEIYDTKCSGCHGSYTGSDNHLEMVTWCMEKPTKDLKTDLHRAAAVDEKFIETLNEFGAKKGLWNSSAFNATGGYLCPPLDGIWARAPYLHNGSVPTLYDLLLPAEKRPRRFVRGNPAYNQEHGGFVTAEFATRRSFEFDTSREGNSNEGHDAEGLTVDSEADRLALVAYLLTL